MTDGISIKVEGLKKVQKDLFSYGNKLGRKVTLDALKVGGRIVQKQAKINAPKHSGTLRRGIVLRVSKLNRLNKNNKVGLYLDLRKQGKRNNPKNAFYGRFVEQGYNAKGKYPENGARSGKRRTLPSNTDVPGQEYIHRAYITRRRKATQETIKAVFRGSEIIKRGTRLS